MPDRMSDFLPARMPKCMPDSMPECMLDRMPDRIAGYVCTTDTSFASPGPKADNMSQCMPDFTATHASKPRKCPSLYEGCCVRAQTRLDANVPRFLPNRFSG